MSIFLKNGDEELKES